jgi:hypothetical protein
VDAADLDLDLDRSGTRCTTALNERASIPTGVKSRLALRVCIAIRTRFRNGGKSSRIGSALSSRSQRGSRSHLTEEPGQKDRQRHTDPPNEDGHGSSIRIVA